MPQVLTYTISSNDENEEWTVVANGGVDYTVAQGKTVVLASAPTGLVTITLPTASGDNADRVVIIKKMDATLNSVLIDGNGSETIDGTLTITLTTQYESRTLVSDGSNWNII